MRIINFIVKHLKGTQILYLARKLRKYIYIYIFRTVIHVPVKIKKVNKQFFGGTAGRTICPDKITKESVVYSFGLGLDISFDLALINSFGCRVYGADPTPKSVEFLQSQDLPSEFTFKKVAIANYDGEICLYFPENQDHVSLTSGDDGARSGKTMTFPCITIETFMKDYGHTHIDILKMDIKGPEFDIIPQLLRNNVSFDQLVLEFAPECVEDGNEKLKKVLKLLETHDYYVFHVEPTPGYDISIMKV